VTKRSFISSMTTIRFGVRWTAFAAPWACSRAPTAQPRSRPRRRSPEISLPVAITVFPEDVYRAPETWARRAYRNLIYFREVDKGGHFAAWEQLSFGRHSSR